MSAGRAVEAQAYDVLARHQQRGPSGCSCPARLEPGESWAVHVVSVMAARGLLVARAVRPKDELPPPVEAEPVEDNDPRLPILLEYLARPGEQDALWLRRIGRRVLARLDEAGGVDPDDVPRSVLLGTRRVMMSRRQLAAYKLMHPPTLGPPPERGT